MSLLSDTHWHNAIFHAYRCICIYIVICLWMCHCFYSYLLSANSLKRRTLTAPRYCTSNCTFAQQFDQSSLIHIYVYIYIHCTQSIALKVLRLKSKTRKQMFEVTHVLHHSMHKSYQKTHSHKDPDSKTRETNEPECNAHKGTQKINHVTCSV